MIQLHKQAHFEVVQVRRHLCSTSKLKEFLLCLRMQAYLEEGSYYWTIYCSLTKNIVQFPSDVSYTSMKRLSKKKKHK